LSAAAEYWDLGSGPNLVKASGPGHDSCTAPLLTVRPPVTRIGQVDRKAPADDGGFVGENGIWADLGD
jgi:hypothetical protein